MSRVQRRQKKNYYTLKHYYISISVVYPTYPKSSWEHKAYAWQQYSVQGRIIDIQRSRATSGRNFIEQINEGSNLFGCSFCNRGNARAPIQFRRERQFQNLKTWFFFNSGLTHFHINSTRVTLLVTLKKLNFFSIGINKPLPGPVHSVL